MTLQERLRALRATLWGDDGKTLDEARERIDALETELKQYKAAAPLCDKHKPTGGARSTCLVCAGTALSAALSRISYACEPPNEYECSAYDVHCSETAVVHQVRDRIDALERENAALRKDAERYRWMVGNYDALTIYTSAFLNSANKESVDAAIDAAMEQR